MTPSRTSLALATAALLFPFTPLPSQGSRDADQELRLREQERRLEALEAHLATQDERDPGAFVGYDGGFVIRSRDLQRDPYELRINGRMQFRYAGFAPERDSFSNLGTRQSGTDVPIRTRSRNDFEIERGRLEFRGTFADPALHFYINIDADTDDNHRAVFHDYWVNYDVTPDTSVYLGKAFVPGSREWLGGSTRTHFADRSMATTFFRPDRSVGVWVIGNATENLHYRAMIGNGFNTTDLARSQVNSDLAYSASLWFEPNGKFGKGYADLQCEPEVRSRFGASGSYAEESGTTPNGSALAETTFLRLDDGTRLTSLGVEHYDLTLLAVDAAVKYRGFSLHGEGYYRWIDRIRPTGAAPAMFPFMRNESYGGYLTAGYMVVAERAEVVLMTSTVQGDFKDTWEYGIAFNYYVDGTHKNKVTLDVIDLDGSPASNSGPNYSVGDDGVMVRIQHQIAF